MPDTPESTSVRPRRIVIGIFGSIVVCKAPFVIRALREAGHEVRTVPTEVALRFIGAPTLATVFRASMSSGVFDGPAAVGHVAVGEWAGLVVVAPASADLLARIAVGRANDLFAATILTTTASVMLTPTMHTQI